MKPLILTTLLLCASCAAFAPLVPPMPSGEGCAAMCERLEALACPWRDAAGRDDTPGTSDDVPCVTWCPKLVQSGMPVATKCTAQAASCEEAADCE